MNKTNPFCKSCKQSYNTLNGCYCTMLKRNVEYASEPPCSTKVKSETK